ncbi:MAG: hypothetical protein KGQ59_04535 [Bdellovibrionales bacterium]|nr:hypothetical protein [Bdellovibrionales bacterium]
MSGGVRCWGQNAYGQLGNNSQIDGKVPVKVNGLEAGVIAIATGAIHSCAMTVNGVFCWGFGQYGQLGIVPPTSRSLKCLECAAEDASVSGHRPDWHTPRDHESRES